MKVNGSRRGGSRFRGRLQRRRRKVLSSSGIGKHLAQDGLIIVVVTIESSPALLWLAQTSFPEDLCMYGESEQLMEDARHLVRKALDDCQERNVREWSALKVVVKTSFVLYL